METHVSEHIDLVEVEDPSAVVILFGWMGSSLKHVNKYAELYNERKCSTITAVADPSHVMVRWKSKLADNVMEAVRCAAKVIRKEELGRRQKIPLIIHVFSNGGAFHLEMLEIVIQNQRKSFSEKESQPDEATDDLHLIDERLKLGWEIFDSAPAYLSVKSGIQAITESTPSNPVLQYALILVMLLKGAANSVYALFCSRPTVDIEYWDNMSNSEIGKRQVYLYSAGDHVTDITMLEELIETRKSKGAEVIAKRFELSKHVQHMRKYKKEYCEVIDTALARSMQGRNEAATTTHELS